MEGPGIFIIGHLNPSTRKCRFSPKCGQHGHGSFDLADCFAASTFRELKLMPGLSAACIEYNGELSPTFSGLKNRRAVRRPIVRAVNKERCLVFAQEHEHWTDE